jgi:hypothetical protein
MNWAMIGAGAVVLAAGWKFRQHLMARVEAESDRAFNEERYVEAADIISAGIGGPATLLWMLMGIGGGLLIGFGL